MRDIADTFGMDATTSQIDLLGKLLDVAALRQQVIAHNVANVNTPGFRRLEVSFEQALASAIDHSDPSAAAKIEPRITEATGGTSRQDGNNVDIDAEVGRLNKNALLYNAYAQIISSKLAAMRSAISGR